MAKSKKGKKSKKGAVKVRDLSPRKNAQGGTTNKSGIITVRKAGGGSQDY